MPREADWYLTLVDVATVVAGLAAQVSENGDVKNYSRATERRAVSPMLGKRL